MLSEASSQEDGEGLPPLCGLSSATNRLRLYLPTLDPAQQPRPGEDLRQGERQVAVVGDIVIATGTRSEEHTSELQSPDHLVSRLLLAQKTTPPSPSSRYTPAHA